MIKSIIEGVRNRISIGCSHSEIYIAGFRDGAKADYKCVDCDRRVYPQHHSKKWVYKSDDIYKDE